MKRLVYIYLLACASVVVGALIDVDTKGGRREKGSGSPCLTCGQNENSSSCMATAHLADNLIKKLARPFLGRSSSEISGVSPCLTCGQNENPSSCMATAHLADNLIKKLARPFFGRATS